MNNSSHQPKKHSFAEALMAMPDIGEDADFERVDHSGEVETGLIHDLTVPVDELDTDA
jgi:hypothetical protein